MLHQRKSGAETVLSGLPACSRNQIRQEETFVDRIDPNPMFTHPLKIRAQINEVKELCVKLKM